MIEMTLPEVFHLGDYDKDDFINPFEETNQTRNW
jgi:hypothetical protein